ncbi:DUF4097 family beta strand repeat protein [Weissella diestrammenae]|uniref:DUF4097 family beta strand repeat protein n=1 Tax=Weissella diestrammenae TaxID=1162633 RepID=A0A7G9T406_9LACO|nr:DUF4097 family beta strand repeat-containing protein [Weissella diestrammenae]MCM0583028.1 DUF4097 family beta strand repeat protein [Weissella diestrammenae]QNN74831.1 DUF4097 family beta strand repeat protein [Weissella diestrammenae]
MNDALEKSIGAIFDAYPETTALNEFKEEVMSDASEALQDYQRQNPTISEPDAIRAILDSLGDIAAIAKMIAGETTEVAVFSQATQDYRQILVNAYAGQVYISRGDGQEVKVHQLTNIDRPEFAVQVQNEDQQLRITMPKPTGHGLFNFFKSNFSSRFRNVIKIEVPSNFMGDLKLSVNAGEVFVSDLDLQGDLKTSLIAGALNVEHVNAGNVDADISAGKAKFSQVNASNQFIGSVSAGDLKLMDTTGQFDIEVAAGNLVAHQVVGAGGFHANAGNIDVDWAQVSGNIHLDTALGNITMRFMTDISFKIKGNTTMGMIKVLREHTVLNSSGNLDAQVGFTPAFNVYASTSLGAIVIK